MPLSVSLRMMSPEPEPEEAANSGDRIIEEPAETISVPESEPLSSPEPQSPPPDEVPPETDNKEPLSTAENVSLQHEDPQEGVPPETEAATHSGTGDSNTLEPQQPVSNPFEELFMRINEMKDSTYPLSAKKKGIQGRVVVMLKLDAEGNLVSSDIIQSSSYSILDEAALDLINRVLERPCRHNLGKDVVLKLPVNYRLR